MEQADGEEGQLQGQGQQGEEDEHFDLCSNANAYQIIVADAADAVSVNFSGRCKFLQI